MDIQKEKLDYTAMLVAEDAITQDQCDTLKLSDGMHVLYSYQLSPAIIDCINWGWSSWLKAKARAVPEGFVLVPKEPTDAMIKAGYKHCEMTGILPHSFYKAMIAAAQEPSNEH